MAQETPDFRVNLGHLQVESLTATALFAAGIGYIWLWSVVSQMASVGSAPLSTWLGAGLLAAGVTAGPG